MCSWSDEANVRYVSGAPQLWVAGSRPLVPLRAGARDRRRPPAQHLGRGDPADIPHENLYGISFNSTNFLEALRRVEGAATARTVGTDGLTPSSAAALAQGVPVGGARGRRAPVASGPPGQASSGGRRDPRIGPGRRGGAGRGSGSTRSRTHRAPAHRRLHGGDGRGGRYDPGVAGRCVDHVAGAPVASRRAGTSRSTKATSWHSTPG